MEVHALRRRGWSISAIARHLGRDRKTVRAHLSGERTLGERRPAGPDPFDGFEPYVRQRLAEDPHLWGTALFDEARALGYEQSYVTFVRKIRDRELRPPCGVCGRTRGQAVAIIDHPPGEECQWDWAQLGDTPWGSTVFVLVGVLSHSGKFRAWLSHRQDQAHLVEGIDEVLSRTQHHLPHPPRPPRPARHIPLQHRPLVPVPAARPHRQPDRRPTGTIHHPDRRTPPRPTTATHPAPEHGPSPTSQHSNTRARRRPRGSASAR